MARLVNLHSSDFSGGVNLRDPLIALRPDELIASQNMEPAENGLALKGRGGQAGYGGNTTAIDANPIRSLFRWYKNDGTGILVASSGTQLWKGTDADGTSASIATGLTSGLRFTGTGWTAKNLLYLANGTDAVKTFDGTTVANLGGSPPAYGFIFFHLDRLWLVNDTEGRFTPLNTDNSWPAANAINISDPKGSRTRFAVSYNGMVLIGKEAGIFRFRGSPVLGGDLAMYTSIGCVAGYATAVTDFGVIYRGPDGIYLTDGFSVTPLSEKIKPLFTGTFSDSVGVYYPTKKQYWYSYATGGTNDTLWVGTFILHPSLGRIITWHQYTGFRADSFAIWNGGSDSGQIYYGVANNGLIRRADTGSQDVGSDYQCLVQPRHQDHELPSLAKLPRWLLLSTESENDVTVDTYIDFQRRATNTVAKEQLEGVLKWASSASPADSTTFWNTNVWADIAGGKKPVKVSLLGPQTLGNYVGLRFANTGDGPDFQLYAYDLISHAYESLKSVDKFSV